MFIKNEVYKFQNNSQRPSMFQLQVMYVFGSVSVKRANTGLYLILKSQKKTIWIFKNGPFTTVGIDIEIEVILIDSEISISLCHLSPKCQTDKKISHISHYVFKMR